MQWGSDYESARSALAPNAGRIQAHVLHAQVVLGEGGTGADCELRGLDARCVSNLVWALVKLEVSWR